MAHVSKNKLSNKTEKDLLDQFSHLFVGATKLEASELFDSILTPTERIMLVKRVAIVLMLTDGFSTYKISKTLKVSDSTVRLIREQYKDGEFFALLKQTKKSSFDHKKFWETVDVLLRLGMPPMGRGRWKSLYK